MADIKLKQLEDQLKRIGCNFRFWGRSELRELANVLLPNEVVMHCVNGSYEGGFALLAATNQRVLLIDKKPFYLTLEDIRFDMISEIDYNHRLLNSTVFICTPNKALRFLGYNQIRLRQLFHFVQTQVMEIRQHYQHQGQLWKEYAESLSQPANAAPPVQTAAPQPEPVAAYAAGMPQQLPGVTATDNSGTVPVQSAATQAATPQHHRRMPLHPAAYHTVAPVIRAYTRMPMMSRQRRFLGSRAINIGNYQRGAS